LFISSKKHFVVEVAALAVRQHRLRLIQWLISSAICCSSRAALPSMLDSGFPRKSNGRVVLGIPLGLVFAIEDGRSDRTKLAAQGPCCGVLARHLDEAGWVVAFSDQDARRLHQRRCCCAKHLAIEDRSPFATALCRRDVNADWRSDALALKRGTFRCSYGADLASSEIKTFGPACCCRSGGVSIFAHGGSRDQGDLSNDRRS
jgi:hypothetical protein